MAEEDPGGRGGQLGPQFDSDDYDLALRIVRNLNVIGYEDMSGALKVAYSKLMRRAVERDARITTKNTLFAGIGDAGKSGSMMGYHFRLINEDISEENFLDEDKVDLLERGLIENIVLVDDVISTGRQASDEIKKLTSKVIPLGVKNVFLLTVCGMRDGIQKVEADTNAYTFSAYEYDVVDTVMSLDSTFYAGIPFDEREAVRDRLKYYGEICARKSPLGYGSVGGLLVFYYNTPNSTIPVVWGDANGWIPLFRRIRRINGITAYFSQFDRAVKERTKSVEKEKEQSGTVGAATAELTIFVEGKIDEMFFDVLVKEYSLAARLGLEKVTVISIGGAHWSERLLDTLTTLVGPSVFVFDADYRARESKQPNVRLNNEKLVVLDPGVVGLLDLEALLQNEEARAYLRIPDELTIDSAQVPQLFERHVLRMGPRSLLEKRIRFMVPRFIDAGKLDALIRSLRALAKLDK